MEPRILFIEICNYKDYPIGGYLAFAKQMITAFGSELVLVGMSSDDTPVGVWTKKEINGQEFDFFSVCKVEMSHKKSFTPGRLRAYLAVRKYRHKILERPFDNVFIQTPEVLLALSGMPLKNLCTRIPGVENPMSISRYWYGKYFARVFDLFYFKALSRSNIIFASADSKAIDDFVLRGKHELPRERIVQFPTRVNTAIFKPVSREEMRRDLKLSLSSKIIVTSGRLSKLKGWELMLGSFRLFRNTYPDSLFVFLGDGEDRATIEQYIVDNSMNDHVLLVGRVDHETISRYLNAADLFVMGSFIEGWSTALVEAIACATPVVCTNFSSAADLIGEAENGFVLDNRSEADFAQAMLKALEIPESNLTAKALEMEAYASANLKRDILAHWKLV